MQYRFIDETTSDELLENNKKREIPRNEGAVF